jgi:hypothetical protein
LQKRLQTQKQKDKINTMNTTLNTLINTINMEINENVIKGLGSFGYSHEEATKLVNEYADFDIVSDAAQFPAVETEIPFDQEFSF